MMILTPAGERYRCDYGWLQSYHLFSFGDYFDPKNLHWGQLRVYNDDLIAPHTGFDTHFHKEMEIVTIVLQGAVTHEDSTGNKKRITAKMVQRMSAGTGVQHSEYNHEDNPLHLHQIWILPNEAVSTSKKVSLSKRKEARHPWTFGPSFFAIKQIVSMRRRDVFSSYRASLRLATSGIYMPVSTKPVSSMASQPSQPSDPPSHPSDPPSHPSDPPSHPSDPPSHPSDPPSHPSDPPSHPSHPSPPVSYPVSTPPVPSPGSHFSPGIHAPMAAAPKVTPSAVKKPRRVIPLLPPCEGIWPSGPLGVFVDIIKTLKVFKN